MELDILKGGEKLIQETRPVLFVENDKPEKHEALLSYLHKLNYTVYWVVTPLFEYPNPADNKENIFGSTCAFNMVAFPEEQSQPESPTNKGVHIANMFKWCRENLREVLLTDIAGQTDQYIVLD
jgi:hypothetical protein